MRLSEHDFIGKLDIPTEGYILSASKNIATMEHITFNRNNYIKCSNGVIYNFFYFTIIVIYYYLIIVF